MSSFLYKSLKNYATFATLEEHAQRFAGDSKAQSLEQSRELFRKLLEDDLLESYDDAVRKIVDTEPASNGPQAKISSIATPTRNRTEHLREFLQTFAQSARTHDRKIRFVVSDQSDAPSTRQANLELLSKVKKEFDIPCFYAADTDRQEFAKQLSQTAGVPPGVVRFAC